MRAGANAAALGLLVVASFAFTPAGVRVAEAETPEDRAGAATTADPATAASRSGPADTARALVALEPAMSDAPVCSVDEGPPRRVATSPASVVADLREAARLQAQLEAHDIRPLNGRGYNYRRHTGPLSDLAVVHRELAR